MLNDNLSNKMKNDDILSSMRPSRDTHSNNQESFQLDFEDDKKSVDAVCDFDLSKSIEDSSERDGPAYEEKEREIFKRVKHEQR